ncbi:U3 small nucleolar ribonucleoprotein protein MPP10 isoform X2 [Triplophysa rosa]|uniref:U3 small nucleolar ribonucleoprotein protein MPP10 isoform X2 n=1 Tax=Triplophysa rosa TaxID=992332 RepID=UPI002545D3F5|nr:U3 small nucleolar ribonucleoprotein protein MPP10 isoform X2 [Triplophysa rosa]
MASGDGRNTLGSCLQLINSNTAHPELFLSVQDALATDLTFLTKTLYDLHKAHEPAGCKGSPLEQLVVENFDEEQIWQELELQNTALLAHFEEAVQQTVKDDTITFLEDTEEEEDNDLDDGDNQDLEGESAEEDEDDDEEEEFQTKPSEDHEEDDLSGEDSDVDFDVDKFEEKTKQQRQSTTKKAKSNRTVSEVDDRFFKLSEMEAFLDDMDKREGKTTEEEIDYFQDFPTDEDEELGFDKPVASKKLKKTRSSRNMKYKDFFDPVVGEPDQTDPDEENEAESNDALEGAEDNNDVDDLEEEDDMNEEDFDMEDDDMDDKARNYLRKVTFDLPDESEGEDVEDILGGKAKNTPKPESKSSFEKRQEKMAQKIEELEKDALSEKPWQLMGEVTSQTRPENSMLEEDVTFDQASRMAPAITEETTLQLEDIIKQRIKDQVWDDVVRKEKPKEEVFEYKKRLTLDHEKSKLSLAEVYEQEYLKQTQDKKEEEENPAHVEIQKLMDTLFLKLDALSHFYFTPKPHIPEVKVVSNMPSITMEEVAPVSASDATLLAPEEIKEKNKAGDLLGDTEKTTTDKKRARRKKKLLKRMKVQEREKRQKLKQIKSGEIKKNSKAEVEQTIKKLTKGGKAKVLTNDGMDKALRSSQAFFSQLQDQVKSQIKGSKDKTGKKKKQKEVSVNKLKL